MDGTTIALWGVSTTTGLGIKAYLWNRWLTRSKTGKRAKVNKRQRSDHAAINRLERELGEPVTAWSSDDAPGKTARANIWTTPVINDSRYRRQWDRHGTVHRFWNAYAGCCSTGVHGEADRNCTYRKCTNTGMHMHM